MANKTFCILSLDLGKKNLGYSLFIYDDKNKYIDLEKCKLKFGIFNIDDEIKKKDNIPLRRCITINKFINDIHDKYEITHAIIERQVITNVVAMSLMYALITVLISVGVVKINLFDPKLKFKLFGINYNTKHKQHKKLSTDMAKIFISFFYESKLNKFEKYKKRDDISDAVIQCLAYMSANNIIRDNVDEFKKNLFYVFL